METKDMIDWGSQEMSPRIKQRLEQALKDPKRAEAGRIRIDRPAGKYDENAEPEGVVQNPNHFHHGYHSSSIIIVKEIGTYLKKTYPGWGWGVQINEFGHMIYITNSHLHTGYGARIRMEDVMLTPARSHAIILKETGELLERFGMLRMGLRGENLTRLVEAPRDAAGQCIPDISDLEDKKARTQAEIAKKIAKGDIRIFEVNGQKMVRIKK
jgi:hypothetical protein